MTDAAQARHSGKVSSAFLSARRPFRTRGNPARREHRRSRLLSDSGGGETAVAAHFGEVDEGGDAGQNAVLAGSFGVEAVGEAGAAFGEGVEEEHDFVVVRLL